MDHHHSGPGEVTRTSPDFVVDLLSGTSIEPVQPPKPAPRRRARKAPPMPTQGPRQALPPADDDGLVFLPTERVIVSTDFDDRLDSISIEDSAFRIPSSAGPCEEDFSSLQFRKASSAPPVDFDQVHIVRDSGSTLSGGDDLLLASVPYHTLRIEPSPCLTLDTRKHRRSRGPDVTGRLMSAGSFGNDLDSLLNNPVASEPVRSSSTPMLNIDVDTPPEDGFLSHSEQYGNPLAVDKTMVRKLNSFFGESKDTATTLEAEVFKSLMMGGQQREFDSNAASKPPKKTLTGSAWSLASKLAGSNISLSGKQKKGQDGDTSSNKKGQEDNSGDQPFQRTKERRSFKGRVAAVAAMMRHGMSGSSNSSSAPKTFGIPLHLCHMSTKYELVPLLVEVCVGIIDERGLDSQGIYRIPGNAGVVHELQEQIDKEPQLNVDSELWREVNVVASLLKLFFRKLPKSLLPSEQYDELIEANRMENSDERLKRLKTLVDKLPECNYNTLSFLMSHLNRVASQHYENKMDAYNLAIMFGPALVRPEDDTMMSMLKDMADQSQIVESLIRHCDWFFHPMNEDLDVPEDIKDETTSPQLLPNVENLVEIARDRSRKQKTKEADDALADMTAALQDMNSKGIGLPYLKAKLKETENIVINAVRQASPAVGRVKRSQTARSPPYESDVPHVSSRTMDAVVTSPSSETRWFIQDSKNEWAEKRAAADVKDVELKCYPAYHYDPYGTLYSLTDGVRPSTLEKNTAKSASAECLGGPSKLPSESGALLMPSHSTSFAIDSAENPVMLVSRPKPKPRPRLPPKPQVAAQKVASGQDDLGSGDLAGNRRPKPRPSDGSPVGKAGYADQAVMAQLSSILKQRHNADVSSE